MPFSGIVLIATAWKEDWTRLTGPIFGSASWLHRSGWKVLLSQVLPHSGALLPICLAVLNTAQRKSGCRILGGFCLEAAPAYFLQFSYSPSQTWEFSGATWFWKLLPETTRPEGDQLSFLD